MKITTLSKTGPMSRVFHVQIKDSYDLALTFLRMQEWYESPKFRHKNFTMQEYMRWYAKGKGKGNFTYMTDWSGFNVPSTAVEAVMNMNLHVGWDGDWSRLEYELFDKLMARGLVGTPKPYNREFAPGGRKNFEVRAPFYLIGTSKDEDLRHEAAHGRFFVDPAYKRKVTAILQSNTKAHAPLRRHLLTMGYCLATLYDEVHAYILDSLPSSVRTTKPLLAMRKELRALWP